MKRSYLPWFLGLITIGLLIPQSLSAGNRKSGPRATTATPPITVILGSSPQLTAVDPYSNAVSSSDGLKPARPFWYSVDQNGLTILRLGDNKVVYTALWPATIDIAMPDGEFVTIPAPPWQPVGMTVSYPTDEALASNSETPATYIYVVMARSGYRWESNLANPPPGQSPNLRDKIVPMQSGDDPSWESSMLVQIDVTDPTFPVSLYPAGPVICAALLGHGAGQPAFDPSTGNVYVGNMPSRSLPIASAATPDLTSFISVIAPLAPPVAEAAGGEVAGAPEPPMVVICGPEHPDEGLLAGEPYVWPCVSSGDGPSVWEFGNLPTWLAAHQEKVANETGVRAFDGLLYGTPPADGTYTFQARVTDYADPEAGPLTSEWTTFTLNVIPTGVAAEAEAGFEAGIPGGQGVPGTIAGAASGTPTAQPGTECIPAPTSSPGSVVPAWIDVEPSYVDGVFKGCYVLGTPPVSGEYYEFTLPNFNFVYPFDREPVIFSGNVAGPYVFDPLPANVSISGLAWHQIEKIHDPSTEADVLNAELIGVEPLTGQLYRILLPQGVPEGSGGEATVAAPETSVEPDKITPEGQPLLASASLRADIYNQLTAGRVIAFGDLVVEADRDIFVSAPWILDPTGPVIPIGGPIDQDLATIDNGALFKVKNTYDQSGAVINSSVSIVELPGVQASFLGLNSDLRPAATGETGQQDNGVLWVTGTNTGGVAVVDTAQELVAQAASVEGTSALAGVAVDTGTSAAYVADPLMQRVAIFNNAYLPRAPEIWLGLDATTTFEIGTAGAFSVMATGTPYPTMSYSGALPSGINFVDNGDGTAIFSGTAAAGSGGDYTISVTATNNAGSDSASFVLTVPLAPQITSAPTTTFTEGQAGTFTVTGIGAPGPVTLTITATLPNGLTFTDNEDGTATLAGTPAEGTAGPYLFDITVATSTGYPPNAIQPFTLIILPGSGGGTDTAPAFTSAAAAAITEGQLLSFGISASGSPAPAITQVGALPSGVSFVYLGNGTAVLVGTPASGTHGSYPLTITATNRAGSANQNFVLTVNPSSQTAPSFTSANVANFKAGVAGSFTVIATGTPAPTLTIWGSLPNGVNFTDNKNGTATLAGTPAVGSAPSYQFTITAENGITPNATQYFTLNVAAASTLSVTPASMSFAYTVGGTVPSAQNVSVSGTSALSFNASTSAAWLIASPGSGSTPGNVGVSVNPSGLAAGTYNGTVTIASADAANSPQTVAVTLTVAPAPTLNVSPSSLSFAYTINGSLPSGQNINLSSSGSALSYTVSTGGGAWLSAVGGGTTPGSVSVSVNPSGLAAGTYNGTVTITSAAAGNSPRTVAVTLTVNPAPALSVSPSALSFAYTIGGSNPAAQTVRVTSSGAALNYTVSSNAAWLTTGAGGNTPGNVSVSVSPSGLTAGTYNGIVTITSSAAGNSPQTLAVTLTVNPQIQTLQITTATLPSGTIGQPYTAQLAAQGGTPPYAWRTTGSVPRGLSMSAAGVLSGTPNRAGSYNFTVRVTDSAARTANKSFSITIAR